MQDPKDPLPKPALLLWKVVCFPSRVWHPETPLGRWCLEESGGALLCSILQEKLSQPRGHCGCRAGRGTLLQRKWDPGHLCFSLGSSQSLPGSGGDPASPSPAAAGRMGCVWGRGCSPPTARQLLELQSSVTGLSDHLNASVVIPKHRVLLRPCLSGFCSWWGSCPHGPGQCSEGHLQALLSGCWRGKSLAKPF